MIRFALGLLFVAAAAPAAGIPEYLAAGAKLDAARVASLEAAVAQANNSTLPDRLHLLGWYNAHPEAASSARRVALLTAMFAKGELGRLALNINAARLTGEGYKAAKAALLERAGKSALPLDWSNAAWFIFYEEPDEAVSLTAEHGLLRDTAALAATFLLGVVTPDARSTPFGRSLLDLVKDTPDPLFQFVFGSTLRDQGATLYAAGKTEWDYTALANESLARATKAEPQETGCSFVPAKLPARSASLPLAAVIPEDSTGAVRFHALIGCSGHTAGLEWIDGPSAQVSAAKKELAVREFDVPLENGKPVQSLRIVSGGRKSR